MRAYIPSRGRAKLVSKGPAARLLNPVFVVPSYEIGEYERELAVAGLTNAQVMGMDYAGIADKRRLIGLHAFMHGHGKFVMIDDDLDFLVRRAEDNWQLRSAASEEVVGMLDWIQLKLDTHAQVGISSREGNNRAGVGGPDTLFDENTRCMRILAYQTDTFNKMEHNRVEFMEDFDIALQLLRSGHQNILSYWWAQGQGKTNQAGGCSIYRDHASHERSAHRLAELHPGIVRLRQKENKTDAGGFGTRTEVTISWKKAAKEGQQRDRAV